MRKLSAAIIMLSVLAFATGCATTANPTPYSGSAHQHIT